MLTTSFLFALVTATSFLFILIHGPYIEHSEQSAD